MNTQANRFRETLSGHARFARSLAVAAVLAAGPFTGPVLAVGPADGSQLVSSAQLSAAASELAAKWAGQWTSTYENTVTALTLALDPGSDTPVLRGVLSITPGLGAASEAGITNLHVQGDRVSFSVLHPGPRPVGMVNYWGALSGGQLRLHASVDDGVATGSPGGSPSGLPGDARGRGGADSGGGRSAVSPRGALQFDPAPVFTRQAE